VTGTTNGTERHEASAAWRESVAAGMPLSGAELAARFGRSPRWGRDVIAACRAATSPAAAVATVGADSAAATGRGTAGGPALAPVAPPAASRAVRRVTTAAVSLVALVAAAASYSHMRQLAEAAGEGDMAAVLPLSVDGLVVAASMSLLSAKRAGQRAGALPWLALAAGLGASLAANVAAAQPTVVGRLVAAWPPAAFALSFELLLRQHGRQVTP
jgi:hypothetical protein